MAKQTVAAERQKLLAGVTRLANAVRSALGPSGRSVNLDKRWDSPTVTKDGVTVASELELADAYENLGARLVSEAAARTNDAVGDGTTTATILAKAIFEEGLKRIVAGANALALSRGVQKAVDDVDAALAKMANQLKLSEAETIATLCSGGDVELGRLIGAALKEAGDSGLVFIEASPSEATTMKVVNAISFDRGFMSPHFINNLGEMSVVLEDVAVVIVHGKLTKIKDCLPLLEAVVQSRQSILAIADDVEGELLALLVVNKLRGILNVCAVKSPGYGNGRQALLEDLAIFTGAKLLFTPALLSQIADGPMAEVQLQFKASVKFEEAQQVARLFEERVRRAGGSVWREESATTTSFGRDVLSLFGHCKKAIIDKDKTILFECAGSLDSVEHRCVTIEEEMAATSSDSNREKLAERLIRLRRRTVVLQIGASKEENARERLRLADDALHASLAALEEGVVPGGGVALLLAQGAIDILRLDGDERVGAEVLRRALEQPMRQIAANAGVDDDVVLGRVRELPAGHGYDAAHDCYVEMVGAGIIDPVKVVRTALRNAASVASLLLTTEALVTEARPMSENNDMAVD